ncbi:hypothetical protein [Streptomyces sp. NPDC047028]|uniref:hypothetical protein n=1 Tax=Streptomyces sp. NPDC047028 TaxID=3155793 RepID=UPI0033D1B88C
MLGNEALQIGEAPAFASPAEELFTTAPARVINKQDKNFEPAWDALTSGSTAQLPLT